MECNLLSKRIVIIVTDDANVSMPHLKSLQC